MEDIPSSPFDRKRRRHEDRTPGDGGPADKVGFSLRDPEYD